MIDFAVFMVMSVLESSAVFYLAFKIFKIDLYPKEIVFVGIVMAFISYVLRNTYQLSEMDVIVQYALMICFMWLLFRIHLFYAIIMTGMSYQLYMLIQSLLFLFMESLGISDFQFHHVTIGIYLLQVFNVAGAFGIGYWVGKRRKGFDFIPDKPDEKIHIGTQEKVLFILSVPSVLAVLLMLRLAQNNSKLFFCVPLFYALILFGYLILSNKKNRGDDFGQPGS